MSERAAQLDASAPAPAGVRAHRTPAAPQEILKSRLDEVVRVGERVLAKAAGQDEPSDEVVKLVHRLRISTRRADAAIRTIGLSATRRARRRTRKGLRALRQAMAPLRAAHARLGLLVDLRDRAAARAYLNGLECSILLCERDVRIEWARTRQELKPRMMRSLRERARRLLRSSRRRQERSEDANAWSRFAAETLPATIDEFRNLASAQGDTISDLHELRIEGKRLRYAVELLEPALDLDGSLLRALKDLQGALGSINDFADAGARVSAYVDAARRVGLASTLRASDSLPAGMMRELKQLATWMDDHRDRAIGEFNANRASLLQPVLDELERLQLRRPFSAATPVSTDGQLTSMRDPANAQPEVRHELNGPPASHQAEERASDLSGSAVTAAADAGVDHECQRLAALDIGTNSIRLVIAEMRPDGSYRVLDDEKDSTRLGAGLVTTGRISEPAMNQAIEAVSRMRSIAEGYGVKWFRAVGTCAVREAENSKEFVKRVQREAGVKLDVISADAEARLAHFSVSTAFDLTGIDAAVVDIGGGSTEIVLSSRGVIEHVYSLMLGAVGLTDEYGLASDDGDGIPQKRFRKMRAQVRDAFKRLIGKPPFVPQTVYGTGGTFTALAAIAMHRHHETDGDPDTLSVRGFDLTRPTLKHLLHWLRGMSSLERSRVSGLSAERADIIVAGATLVDAVLGRLGANAVRVHDRGIRDGLLLQMIRECAPARGAQSRSLESIDPVRSFARSCNYEVAHSEHVTMLALQVFDQFAKATRSPWMTPEARRLLEAAAVLHDVGYYINYAKHHKHSYHLILHSELPGFTHREISIIANVARYHRRAGPKRAHANFARLANKDQLMVRRLAGILRVVDGLDRAHAQHVRSVEIEVRRRQLRFKLRAKFEPSVDMWGAQRKARLLQSSLGREVQFEWVRALSEQSIPAARREAGSLSEVSLTA